MNYWIFIFPLAGALIGWLIHLAFIPFLQRMIAKKREELAGKIGRFAAGVFSLDTLKQKVNDPKHWEVIKPVVETHIDEFLRVKLSKEMPVISMFIGDKTIESMKGIFLKEIGTMFPEVIGGFANNVGREFDVEKTVKERLLQYTAPQFEQAIRQNLAPLFRSIQWLGAISGFIIGLILYLVMFLSQ